MNYIEFELARAKAKSPEKYWNHPGWIAEEKLDGWRYALHFGGGLPRCYLTGRRISLETGLYSEKGLQVPQIWPVRPDFFKYTVLDGEIYPPEGASFRDIAGIMNADVEVAQIRMKQIGPPTYRVFDILYYGGEDVREKSQLERRRLLEVAVDLVDHPLIRLVPQWKPELVAFEEVIKRGGEGLILKDQSAPYGEGWVKVKREHTLDVVVTGFTDARFGRTGKYHGQIGAAKVSVYSSGGQLIEVGQVSGMDDATRQHMTENKEWWIGKVVEISAQEWAKDRLRHPRFVRSRLDADPASCTFAKLLQDLGAKETQCEDKQLQLL